MAIYFLSFVIVRDSTNDDPLIESCAMKLNFNDASIMGSLRVMTYTV